MSHIKTMVDKKPTILVIGAGLAGLAAAHELIQSGLTDVNILEADNCIGGRIKSVGFGGITVAGKTPVVELGASWIHGKGPVYELAESFDLVDHSLVQDEYNGIYIGSDGVRCKTSLVQRAIEEFKKIMEDIYAKRISTADQVRWPSIHDYFLHCLEEVIRQVDENDQQEFREITRTLMKVEEENHGALLSDTSVYVPDEIIPGKNLAVSGGYASLLSRLVNVIMRNRIMLNTKVKVIDYSDPSKIQVHCDFEKGRKTYTADHVIVTLPLGVLKYSHQEMFKPSLPQEKISSIENLGYGTANKVLLYYKDPFWKHGVGGMKIVWRSEETTEEPNLVQRSLPGWAKCLYTFEEMKANPNILIVWVCSEAGKEIERVPIDEIGKVFTKVLRQMLNNQNLPEPDDIIRTSWCSNDLFRGSYAYLRVGSSTGDIKTLASPLEDIHGKPLVLFAGEATHIGYIAMTHGSLDSGVREAKRIKAYSKLKPSVIYV